MVARYYWSVFLHALRATFSYYDFPKEHIKAVNLILPAIIGVWYSWQVHGAAFVISNAWTWLVDVGGMLLLWFIILILANLIISPARMAVDRAAEVQSIEKDKGTLKQKIEELTDEERKKIALRKYDGIEISEAHYPITDEDIRLGVRFHTETKIGLRVKNRGDAAMSKCALRMLSVEYSGLSSNREWIANPSLSEQKLLKWDEGYSPIDGKIDISANGGMGRIILAELERGTISLFKFWYLNGLSQTIQILEGRYRVVFQLEGQCEKDGVRVDLSPQQYEVEFSFRGERLFDVSVSKIDRGKVLPSPVTPQ